MNQEQLEKSIIYQLEGFNEVSKKVETITPETIPADVLDDSLGYASARPSKLFTGNIMWIMATQIKGKRKRFPKGGLNMPVKELATRLLMGLLLFIAPLISMAQVQIDLGAKKTTLRDNAITIGLTYIKSFDSMWNGQDFLIAGKKSYLFITPEANIQTGTQDAFSSIVVKVAGNFVTFKTVDVAGIPNPDVKRVFHVFPIAVGAESNKNFRNINAIFEGGWVPWYQNQAAAPWNRTKIGVFIQGGYKFKVDSTGPEIGGEADQSEEMPNAAILRVKGSAGFDTEAIINVSGLNVGLVGNADAWLDALNGAIYHKIDMRTRVYLTPTNFLDLIYQKGSGAPNFNQGDQWGLGLTVKF